MVRRNQSAGRFAVPCSPDDSRAAGRRRYRVGHCAREQALAEASDYSTARDIARANEARGINPQGPNLLPKEKEEQTYLSRILEAGKKDISNLVEGGKKVADVVSNVGESITDFDKNMANKVKEKRERDALNAEQNAEAKKFINEMNLADKNLPRA